MQDGFDVPAKRYCAGHDEFRWSPWLLSLFLHGWAVVGLWLVADIAASSDRQLSDFDTRAAGENDDSQEILLLVDPRPNRRAEPNSEPSSPVIEPIIDVPSANLTPYRSPPIIPVFNQGPNRGSAIGTSSSSLGDGAAGNHGPGKPGVSFFQIDSTCGMVVYVVDCSASMGEMGGWSEAKRQLVASLTGLPARTCFQVIPYQRHADTLRIGGQTGFLEANPETIRQVIDKLEDMTAEGGTDHLSALRKALVLEPDVIYFLTDADDLTLEQVRLITMRNQSRSIIHTIELNTRNRHRPEMPMQMLARANRGVYRAVEIKR